jgi:hypothetical protein
MSGEDIQAKNFSSPNQAENTTQQLHQHPNDLSRKVNMAVDSEIPKNTLEEDVVDSLTRDFTRMYHKLMIIVFPVNSESIGKDTIVQWDLWGPFFIYLLSARYNKEFIRNEGHSGYRENF